eukprot:m.21837 g.21837  ORF g.21837 m.21837 type:complete len:62 (-) comp7240_c0_seq1:548-733(-)
MAPTNLEQEHHKESNNTNRTITQESNKRQDSPQTTICCVESYEIEELMRWSSSPQYDVCQS